MRLDFFKSAIQIKTDWTVFCCHGITELTTWHKITVCCGAVPIGTGKIPIDNMLWFCPIIPNNIYRRCNGCLNSNLTGSRIHNYKRLETRRVLFTIGVVYGTPLEKLKRIPEMIKAIIEKHEFTTFDRVHFISYGDFSLNYEVVFFVDNPHYHIYMDILQQINFDIYEQFAAEKIDFAFPTQTLVFNKSEINQLVK